MFFADADRVEFGRLLARIFDRFGVRVNAYCLMDNHYHLVLHCPDGGLSDAMHLLGSVYTRHVNDRVGRDGPLFHGRFHAIPILSDEQQLRSVRYVHRNPLDLPGVEVLGDYRWSSHRTYLGHRAQVRFLDVDAVLNQFVDRQSFDAFVCSDLVGGTSGLSGPFDPDRVSSVVNVIADEFGVQGSRVQRSLLLLVADQFNDENGDAVRESLGFATPKSMQQAQVRARQRLAATPELRRIVDRTLGLVA